VDVFSNHLELARAAALAGNVLFSLREEPR
jgi:hypothetical protein